MDPPQPSVPPQPDAPENAETVINPSTEPAQPSSAPPSHETGRFRVVTLHAKGGMGNVFIAKDDQLNRSVALKEIQEPFADDPQVRDRFLREAEVTGQLEHPGIVPVYALGHYPDGRPYYAMRMIRGQSLRHAITALHRNRDDEHAYRLELRRLLNRFITACNTIEYAHSRGVVHRDIKPDNIMLGPYGETLVVDWGLAKLVRSSDVQVDAPTGEEPVFQSPAEATQAGTLTGTPAYMSPEQALGWQDAIKAGSDIYSLGGTLYTLLTGRPPISGDDLGDLLIRIQKQDFQKPREVDPSIPKPLEAICLKAMARSMTARYRTAAELAADIEAFLADEPVTAWKEPASVRAARWVRRHRTLVSTGGASIAILLVALTTIVVLQNSANRRLTVANNNETAARKDAESQRDKAQQNFQMARDAVDRYFTQVSEDPRLAAHGLEPLRRDLLGSAAQFYDRFVAQDAAKGELNYQNAWAKFRLAEMTGEIASPAESAARFEQAVQTFRDLAKLKNGSLASREGVLMAQINLSGLYNRLGQREKEKQALAEALGLARRLVSEHPAVPAGQDLLARCLAGQGHIALDEGDLTAASAAYGQEIRVREQIVKLQPEKQSFQTSLTEAYHNLAVVQQRLEHLDEARKLLDKSLEIDRRLAGQNPDNGYLQHTLARTLTRVGDVAARTGRGDDARKAYREAVDLRIALVRRHPDVLEYRAALAMTADNFGVFCFDRSEYDTAQKYYQHALRESERLASDYPDQPDYQSSFATALMNAAMLCEAQNRPTLAEQYLTAANQIRTRLQHDAPHDLHNNEELAAVRLALAIVETDTHHTQQAENHLRSAKDVFQRLSADHPERSFYKERLGACLKQLADIFKAEGRNDDAIASYQEALKLQRRLVSEHHAVPKYRLDLAGTCINLGNLRNRLGQSALAASAFDEVIQLFPEESRPTLDDNSKSLLETASTGRAVARESLKDPVGMAADYEQAIALAPPNRARILRAMCASSLADAGQLDRAAQVAEPLVADANLDGWLAFELATIFCRESGAKKGPPAKAPDGAQAQRRIEQALRLLRRAADVGFFKDPANRQKLHGPPFLPLLAQNQSFGKLLEEVEKAPSASPSGQAK